MTWPAYLNRPGRFELHLDVSDTPNSHFLFHCLSLFLYYIHSKTTIFITVRNFIRCPGKSKAGMLQMPTRYRAVCPAMSTSYGTATKYTLILTAVRDRRLLFYMLIKCCLRIQAKRVIVLPPWAWSANGSRRAKMPVGMLTIHFRRPDVLQSYCPIDLNVTCAIKSNSQCEFMSVDV